MDRFGPSGMGRMNGNPPPQYSWFCAKLTGKNLNSGAEVTDQKGWAIFAPAFSVNLNCPLTVCS